ncbi:MAG: DUF1512 family protein, partial [Candidatus Nanohaloarchaea archaeon]|nr:DUF1512 family protein [Candidatus Nanohaloarchaea archaeon]
VSPPSDLDPAGMFQKLEHVLDSSEEKMDRYVESLAPDLEEERQADLSMAFKGVYGSHQIYVIIRHFKNLIEETNNYQLGGMIQMMLPLYRELSESQKDATEAFINQVPIGDTVGPLIAAKLIDSEAEEVAEDVVLAEEELDGEKYLVLKSNGPGSRLGKYGNAVRQVVDEHDIAKIITVDAGMRYEGEETGTVVSGTGVLMGGPGVEKGKIEEAATENDIPLEGYVVKQSGPQASKPMHKKIWDGHQEALSYVKDEIRNTDGKVLVVGVGNTCGAGNSSKDVEGLENKLRPYWAEQDEESTSYFGLMKAFPGGGDSQHGSLHSGQNTFQLFQKIVR